MEKNRIAYALAMALLTALLATRVYAATPGNPTPDKLADCRQTKDLDRAIAGCSEAIRAGSKDAQVYVSRGFAYFLKRDHDHALADYEEAIRLNPKEADAFGYRGMIFQIGDDDDRAIADFTKALSLGSSDPRVLVDRGKAYTTKGATAKAIADYSAAIQRDANNRMTPYSPFQMAHILRGVVYLYEGAPDKAQADFKQLTKLNPKEPYFAIWLHLAERRTGSASHLASAHLASAVGNFDMTKWPAPVIRMLLGEETPTTVLASHSAKGMMCEADFYVAEFMYLQNQKEEALRLYKATRQDCLRIYLEAVAANVALRSLGVNP